MRALIFPSMFTLPFISQPHLAFALQLLRKSCATESPDHIQVLVQGMPICFPYRVYFVPDDVYAASRVPGVTSQVALCLGTRHHDGFVRGECLRRLLSVQAPWVAPFVLQLLGEYVVEITSHIDGALSDRTLAQYVEFARENPAHMHRLNQQAISYWNVYYRRAYPERQTYPALRVLGRLALLAGCKPDAWHTAGLP